MLHPPFLLDVDFKGWRLALWSLIEVKGMESQIGDIFSRLFQFLSNAILYPLAYI